MPALLKRPNVTIVGMGRVRCDAPALLSVDLREWSKIRIGLRLQALFQVRDGLECMAEVGVAIDYRATPDAPWRELAAETIAGSTTRPYLHVRTFLSPVRGVCELQVRRTTHEAAPSIYRADAFDWDSLELSDHEPSAPSYHDLHITTAEIPRTSIFNLPFGLRVTATRVGGWELWQSGGEPGALSVRRASEYDAEHWLVLDVAGQVICDSRPQGPVVDWAKVRATTEEDIARHEAEDDATAAAELAPPQEDAP